MLVLSNLQAEVHALSQLEHQNIIRLRGYGHSKQEKKLFLIYDLMPTNVKEVISGMKFFHNEIY